MLPNPNPQQEQRAAIAGAAAGAAAGSAARSVMEAGTMGLTGLMKTIGNATAMTIITCLMVLAWLDGRADRAYLREEIRRAQDQTIAMQERNEVARGRIWDSQTRQHTEVMHAIKNMSDRMERALQPK